MGKNKNLGKYFLGILATFSKTSMINTLMHNDKYFMLHG